MGFTKTLKLMWVYLRPYKTRLLLGLLALLVVDVLQVMPPLILKQFIDQAQKTFAGNASYSPYAWLGALYLIVAIVQGWMRYLWRQMLIKTSHRAAEKVREDYFSKLQRLPPSFYDREPIGELMSLATNDVEAIRFAFGPGLLVFFDALFLLLSTPPMMFWLSPRLAIVCLGPMIFLPFAMEWLEREIHVRFTKTQEQFSKLTTFSQENIQGIRVVKAFVREWTQLTRFDELGKEFVKLNMKLAGVQSAFDPVFTLALTLGLSCLVWYGGNAVTHGTLDLGTFVAFTRYLDQMVWPMTAVGLAITYHQRGKSSLERINGVLAESEEKDASAHAPAAPYSLEAPLLELRNLTFSYGSQGDGAKASLKNVSLKIERGEWCAVVGPIGAGKSTLTRLIAGLYPVPRGTVFWEGVDVCEIPLQERRRKLAMVPQEVFLFSDSLGGNVFLGRDGSEQIQTDGLAREFSAVLSRAGLSEEFMGWSMATPIGERGSNLSGGQRARVTLARAFVRRSPLLILDDALSSVDAGTEQEILDGLEGSQDGRQALLMVTHRFARLWQFDKVFVLKDGELIQSGPPTELAERSGLYKQLLELQRMEEAFDG